jgi:hypothetical protein
MKRIILIFVAAFVFGGVAAACVPSPTPEVPVVLATPSPTATPSPEPSASPTSSPSPTPVSTATPTPIASPAVSKTVVLPKTLPSVGGTGR